MLDVEVVGRSVTCERPVGRELNIQITGSSFCGRSCSCMPTARSLKTATSVLCNKTKLKVAGHSGQAHLCNNHAASSNAKPARWLVDPSREVLTKTNL